MIKFYYGTMGCGKSSYALQLNYQLEQAGFVPLLLKPATDTRDTGVIQSRMGFAKPCYTLQNDAINLIHVSVFFQKSTHLIIDEAQFLSPSLVRELCRLGDEYDKDVIFFGLRTTYTGVLFDGTATIFALADELIELPTLYKDGNKTIMHILKVDGKEVFEGDPIHVGDQEYESVSRKEYFRRQLTNSSE